MTATAGAAELADRISNAYAAAVRQHAQGQYRAMHDAATQAALQQARPWLETAWRQHQARFRNGADLDPAQIRPILAPADTPARQALFRLARYTWSLPYSRGYGRRLRFLVLDAGHDDALIGILGLQSAPINFAPRDRRIDYPAGRKVELVNQTLDAFTLGAVPPYNRLLGGKLVVCAAASQEVRHAYQSKYAGRASWLENRVLPAQLALITTTSAFGRSSIYNRVAYHSSAGGKRLLAEPLGYTRGFGSVHLHAVYPDIKEFLIRKGYQANQGYGRGPKPVWQNIAKALTLLGLSHQQLQHGIPRQAWAFPLARNAWEYFNGQDAAPDYYAEDFATLAEYWKQRWLLPRAARCPDWRRITRDAVREAILPSD